MCVLWTNVCVGVSVVYTGCTFLCLSCIIFILYVHTKCTCVCAVFVCPMFTCVLSVYL
jgi:hypothetical protein